MNIVDSDLGELFEVVKDTIANVPCEIEYINLNGDVMGFWAYGSFDPAYPYQGEGGQPKSQCVEVLVS